MIKATLPDGLKIIIRWHHEAPMEIPEWAMPEGEPAYIGATSTCWIEDAENCDQLALGIAYCHPEDKYTKEAGRKLSLTRAIAEWSRQDRTAVWKAYFSRKGSGSQPQQQNASDLGLKLWQDAFERRN